MFLGQDSAFYLFDLFACSICLICPICLFAQFACLMLVFTFASVHSHSWFRHALTSSSPPFCFLTENHAPVMVLRITIHHPTIPDGFLKVFPSLSSRAASTTNMQKPSVAMIHVRPQSMSQFHIIFGNIYHYVNIITPCALQFQIKVW